MQYHASSYADGVWDAFWYERNLQGDVIAIYDSVGTKLISYVYTAQGRCRQTYYNGASSTRAYTNPIRYRGYYYDKDMELYVLGTRCYDSYTGRFISPDSADYLGANGDLLSFNLYAYCSNNPVIYIDPSGHFVISISALWLGIGISAGMGFGISFATTAYQDFMDDGKIFNGSVGLDEYVGNLVGASLAGTGIGACAVLGAGLGVALVAGETLVVGSLTLSGFTAAVFGASSAFVAGGSGYFVRTAIKRSEDFQLSDMFIEAGANTLSGMLSFVGGVLGGISGVAVPGGKTGIVNFMKYHTRLTYLGVYPTKILISKIKNAMKEKY